MRIAELVVLSMVAVLVLLLVVRPLLNRLLALPVAAPEQFAIAGPVALPCPERGAALALPAPPIGRAYQRPADLDGRNYNIANEIEQMIDINQVEGRVRASSLKRIAELVEQHPNRR